MQCGVPDRAEVQLVVAPCQALHPDSNTSQVHHLQRSCHWHPHIRAIGWTSPHWSPLTQGLWPGQLFAGFLTFRFLCSPATVQCCFDQLDEGTFPITVHALISAGRNLCHCMAPQGPSKLTLPPCLPAASPSPTPPSVSQLCLLKARLTQL